MKAVSLAFIALLATSCPAFSFAQTAETTPSAQETFDQTAAKIQQNQGDLDALFQHAKAAIELNKPQEAVDSYQQMLKINPNLGRVKLELGVLYMGMGNFPAAQPLLEDVLKENPPENVRKQVESILASGGSIQPSDAGNPQQAAANPPPPPAPSEEALVELSKKLLENPNDLDAQFNYASIANQLGKVDDAEEAYRAMLRINPELHRIKLDLGMLYVRAGKFKQAKALFEEVLATNPPDQVKQNVNIVLTSVNNALKTDIFSGSVSVGYNYSSNANSASASGQITYSDISIPLDPDSQSRPDGQVVTSATLTHLHKFDIDSAYWGANLTTTGTLYKSKQLEISGLDLNLYSIKIGPTFDLKKINTQIGFAFTESFITLASSEYIRSPSGDFTIKYAPLANLILDYNYTFESRKFSNSPVSTTNTEHSGVASQHKVGVTYAVTPKDILNSTVTWRKEAAEAYYLGLDQVGATGNYIRVLPYGFSVNTSVGIKETNYKDLDLAISTEKIRRDIESSLGFTISKQLPKNANLSVGYQYRKVKSNIENYEYVDNKFLSSLGWSF